MRQKDWWRRRIVAAFESYFIYQHLGNLSPSERDGVRALRAPAHRARPDAARCASSPSSADEEVEGTRWSFCRDIGPARVVMIDSRAGRVLDPGNRSMVDPEEWEWITEHASRRRRPPADRHVAAADHGPGDALARGLERARRRRRVGQAGQEGRREAAPGARPRALAGVPGRRSGACASTCARSAPAERGAAPSTICVLSGDVHHAYLAEVGFPRGAGRAVGGLAGGLLAVPQPARHQGAAGDPRRLDAHRRARSRARSRSRAGVRDPDVRWRLAHDKPWFNNQVAWLELEGRRAKFVLEKALPAGGRKGRAASWRQVFERSIEPNAVFATGLRHKPGARVMIR